MSPIGSVNPLHASPLTRAEGLMPKIDAGTTTARQVAPTESFGQLLDGVVSNVEAKHDQAQELTRRVLLGENDQLHQSMIAMQEASVAFSMMVEVRNKLVESYQELMRMQV